MLGKTTVVTTSERQYKLDTIEQLCCDSEHPAVIQNWSIDSGNFTEYAVQGAILSVVVLEE